MRLNQKAFKDGVDAALTLSPLRWWVGGLCMVKEETRLQQRIRKTLDREVGGWWVKIWGGPFQASGLPDIIGCVEGYFFGFEVKVPEKGKASPIQLKVLHDIKTKGGACAAIVTSADEAVELVRLTLRRAGRLSDAGGQLRPQGKDGGSLL